MAKDSGAKIALTAGRNQAEQILKQRAAVAKRRGKRAAAEILGAGAIAPGWLIAEGDSWFDYPGADVLSLLQDEYDFGVESVAHYGHTIEQMTYDGNQRTEFQRRLEKLKRLKIEPLAVLLSGGGNDIAGDGFSLLLNHAASGRPALDEAIAQALIERLRLSFLTIVGAIDHLVKESIGRTIPIVIHGYDYPIPDGRGYLGGWWVLPGPWLKPGFSAKGHHSLPFNTAVMHDLMDRYNSMLAALASTPGLKHVRYVDLRGTLKTAKSWDNELHPTDQGFRRVAERFAKALGAVQ